MEELLFLINNSALIGDEEKTYNGLNVLHYAAKRGNLPVVKQIIIRNLIQVCKPFYQLKFPHFDYTHTQIVN